MKKKIASRPTATKILDRKKKLKISHFQFTCKECTIPAENARVCIKLKSHQFPEILSSYEHGNIALLKRSVGQKKPVHAVWRQMGFLHQPSAPRLRHSGTAEGMQKRCILACLHIQRLPQPYTHRQNMHAETFPALHAKQHSLHFHTFQTRF